MREYQLKLLDPTVFNWAWRTDKTTGEIGAGLQGSIDGKTELVWYKNQKQLFKAPTISPQAIRITVPRNRLTISKYVETVLIGLQEQLSSELSEENDDFEEES